MLVLRNQGSSIFRIATSSIIYSVLPPPPRPPPPPPHKKISQFSHSHVTDRLIPFQASLICGIYPKPHQHSDLMLFCTTESKKFMITLLLQLFNLKPDSSHEQVSLMPSALVDGMTLPSTGTSCHFSHETALFTPSSQAQE